MSIDEDEAEDLLKEIEKQVKRRQWGKAIRLEVQDSIPKKLLKILVDELQIEEEDIFRIDGTVDLTVFMKVYGLDGFEEYKMPKFSPIPVYDVEVPTEDIFDPFRRKIF